ncbi:MAG: 3-oxoacyl-ACP synthase III family protein [Sporichthyaceae bacterium]
MKPFTINRHGRIVFPSSYFPELDFSLFSTLEQYEAAVHRDFEEKMPSGTDIAERIAAGKYTNRFQLLRDLALNLFWGNRYALTMYQPRPMRWRDVPRRSNDLYLPVLTPWEDGPRKIAAVAEAFRTLPTAWDEPAEEEVYDLLFDIFGHKLFHATSIPALKPTVPQMLADREALTFVIEDHAPDYPVFSRAEILDHYAEVPELESLGRWARVLHNVYPWPRATTRLAPLHEVDDDQFVVLLVPRDPAVVDFIDRVRTAASKPPVARQPAPIVETVAPARPFPPLDVRRSVRVQPKIAALAALRGEYVCTNDDVIRNTAYNWSPMTAADISAKTGIDSRCYTAKPLEQLALEVSRAAIAKSGYPAQEIGAVLVATCTSDRLIPSMGAYITGQLGLGRTYMSADIVSACAGFPYGLAEGVRLLQEIERPVLLVFAEKFSDKIGTVRPSRMLFADGAAAVVLRPADPGTSGDIDYLQTYAGGPVSEVNSILWPNPEFDGNITVFGPEVKSLAGRYLKQMIDELRNLPDPDTQGHLLAAIDAMVPHQANKVMVSDIAKFVGIPAEKVYFNIERTGNVSAASIPLAIHDAVLEGVIDRPMRIFCPGFGAGAVAGYAVLRLDPSVVARNWTPDPEQNTPPLHAGTSEDAAQAFG